MFVLPVVNVLHGAQFAILFLQLCCCSPVSPLSRGSGVIDPIIGSAIFRHIIAATMIIDFTFLCFECKQIVGLDDRYDQSLQAFPQLEKVELYVPILWHEQFGLLGRFSLRSPFDECTAKMQLQLGQLIQASKNICIFRQNEISPSIIHHP